MATADGAPERPLVAAVALRRADGRVLLVRHVDPARSGAGQRWTLPAEPVSDDEVVEQALARLLRERLHLASKDVEFSETLGLPDAIANVFTCSAWTGDPQYSAADYLDAAWAVPHAPGAIELVDAVGEWLATEFPRPAPAPAAPEAPAARTSKPAPTRATPGATAAPSQPPPQTRPAAKTSEELRAELDAARAALLEAYLALDPEWRDVTLDGEWAPVDLLAHCTTVEAYYAAETRLLLDVPGHTWRAWNAEQAAAERAGRGRPDDRSERTRGETVRAETLAWLDGLEPSQLEAYGNHAERGAVHIRDRIDKIARHDREHADQLAQMLAATADDPEDTLAATTAGPEDSTGGDRNAAPDR